MRAKEHLYKCRILVLLAFRLYGGFVLGRELRKAFYQGAKAAHPDMLDGIDLEKLEARMIEQGRISV